MSIGNWFYFGQSETNGLTFWQTLNGTYVIQLQILLLLFIFTNRFISNQHHLPIYFLLSIFTGVLTGFSGTALAISVVAFSLLSYVVMHFIGSINNKYWKNYWLILCISTLLSLWVCHTQSPGNLLREQAIGVHLNFSTFEIVEMLLKSLVQGVRKWVKFYLNIGSVYLFFIILGSFLLIAKMDIVFNKSKFLWFGLGFSFFALLQCCVSRLAGQLTYIAYWHYISAFVCVFISICLLASYCGCWLYERVSNKERLQPMVITFVIALILFGAYAIGLMTEEIRLREKAWNNGPANLQGVSDIENPLGWQMDCWKKLNDYRWVKTIRE